MTSFDPIWLLSLLSSAHTFVLDDKGTKVVSDYWTGGVVFYIVRSDLNGPEIRLSRNGHWCQCDSTDNNIVFNDATAFPNIADALATYLRVIK